MAPDEFFAVAFGREVYHGRVETPATEPTRRPAFGKVLGEALLVALVGTALAFAANALSPRGLKLSQNYFLTGAKAMATNQPAALTTVTDSTNPPAGTNVSAIAPTPVSVPRLVENGLQSVDSVQAFRFYHDPRREKDLLVFVDARSEESYQRGHIPGAYQLDPYHPEKYLLEAMALGKAAEVIIVYCTGGDCEDSELSAMLLRNVGVPNQKLFIYTGGITDWTSNRFPLETGARKTKKASDPKP